ncbi:MAG: hypothetical protein ACKO6A_00960 [Bacteroidota bacterium]
MQKFYFLILFIFGLKYHQAQGIIDPKHSLTIELGLPNSISNRLFLEIMQGLVHVSPYYQYAMKNGLAFGIGGRYSYFAINEFRVPSKVYGGNHSYGGFFKIGHEKFHSSIFATDIGFKLGFNQNTYYSDLLRTKEIDRINKPCFYFEPNIGLILAVNQVDTYRLSLGYSFLGYSFKQSDIGFFENEDIGYSEKDKKPQASFFTIAFGYTHHFNGKSFEGFDE